MKHFKREAKWMLVIPVVILALGFLLAMFGPYFL